MPPSEMMPLSEIRTFTEPEEYAAAIRGVDLEVSPLTRGPFAASLTRVSLGSMSMLRVTENRPRIMHIAPGEVPLYAVTFHTSPERGVFEGGVPRTADSMTMLGSEESYFQRSDSPVHLGSVALTAEDMQAAGIAAAGFDLSPPPRRSIVTPPTGALEKLRKLHRAAGLLATEAPEVFAHPHVSHALEQALLHNMIACVNTNGVAIDTSAQRRHAAIMRRFRRVLDANPNRPLYILEIAKAIGVSVRGLSTCCQQHLGMGPKQYLLLRRMHLARRALCIADPDVTTVTDVATQYGFWQFGRFAGEYKLLFGELPSVTLRR